MSPVSFLNLVISIALSFSEPSITSNSIAYNYHNRNDKKILKQNGIYYVNGFTKYYHNSNNNFILHEKFNSNNLKKLDNQNLNRSINKYRSFINCLFSVFLLRFLTKSI